MSTIQSPTTPDLLRTLAASEVRVENDEPVDAETLAATGQIINDVRTRGWPAVIDHATRLGDLAPGSPAIIERAELRRALDELDRESRRVLSDAADRIRAFALAQLACLSPLAMNVPGGRAGHTIAPVDRAGCYAPGGRFPLPSSVLMTAVTARAAGVREVWVASPRPAQVTLAAAALADADALLAIGGAQAIAAMAFGSGQVPACDLIVGPGNRWVTAAKKLVVGRVGIDMLAGPSEVLIIADDSADAALVAADLLAQAEHDDDAVPILVTTDAGLIARVNAELHRQLADLPTGPTARAALRNGFAVVCGSMDEAIAISNRLAPEHLEIHTRHAQRVADRCRHYGGVFIGSATAEVLGDYGLGPNHVLPTGRTARFTGGLSVFTFLRIRTWLAPPNTSSRLNSQFGPLCVDVAKLARLEGLEAHARAASARTKV